jgi:long-chain fatty acid transport protein
MRRMTTLARGGLAAAMLAGWLAGPGPAWAAGIWLYELATPDQGTAVAGRAALATDASTAWGNPAGMTQLDQSQFLLGAGALVIQSEFDVSPGTTNTGGGASITSALPQGSGYYVHNFTGSLKDFKLGLALTTLPGLSGDFGNTWAGRYHLESATLLGVAISPVAAYQILPWLSVGAGPSFGFAGLRQTTALNNVLDGLPDGQLRIKSHAWGVGGVVGVLVEPTPRTRIGVQYTTPMSMRFDDVIDEVQGAGRSLQFLRLLVGAIADVPVGSQADIELTWPQQVMVSAYHDFTERFALMGNVGWQNWSAFGTPDVTIHGSSAPTRELAVDQGYTDTWHIAIGAHFRLNPEWLLTGGFAYDSSAVSDANRTLAFAVDQQFRYALGAQYALSQTVTLGVAYTLIYAGLAPINQSGGALVGTVVGNYSPNFIHAIGFNATWKF